jgi:hypothetical protein
MKKSNAYEKIILQACLAGVQCFWSKGIARDFGDRHTSNVVNVPPRICVSNGLLAWTASPDYDFDLMIPSDSTHIKGFLGVLSKRKG